MIYMPPQRNWDLIVCAGQSNMGLTGTVSEITAEQKAPVSNARQWGEWRQLDGTINSQSYDWTLPRPGSVTGFGPDLPFARGMRDGGRYVAVVTLAVISSSIGGWLTATTGFYDLYLKPLIASARIKLSTTVRGLYWCQGEADAGAEATADAYDDNLATLVARFRADYGASLPVVLNRIHTDSDEAFVANLRTSQDNFVASDARSAIFSIDDLTLQVDSVHLSSAAQLTAGARAATAMLGLL